MGALCPHFFLHKIIILTTFRPHEGYKKFFGISRDMIKQLDLYL